MGGAVSSGRDNNELIDNLVGGNYIRSRDVEQVFRALDRAEYMCPEARDQAYKDLAWRYGPLHLSAPCIYSEVMEGLELKPGLSFLNIGSGTGYLSTLVGLMLGSGGISHGVEVNSQVTEYANKKLGQFMENSPILDEFDFCEPKFYCGNGLCLTPLQAPYDRVYCGASCPEEFQNYFKQLIKVGGVLVMPLNDNLLQVKRVSAEEWVSRSVLNVSFAALRVPTKQESTELVKLEEQAPPRLQLLSRGRIRSAMRGGVYRREPELRPPPPYKPAQTKPCPRRICIPVDNDSDVEGLNLLHDLDAESGANEMNALLSLVLSMGQNRVAGSLRFDPVDSSDSSSDDEGHTPRDDPPDDSSGGDDPPPVPPRNPIPIQGTPREAIENNCQESPREVPEVCSIMDTVCDEGKTDIQESNTVNSVTQNQRKPDQGEYSSEHKFQPQSGDSPSLPPTRKRLVETMTCPVQTEHPDRGITWNINAVQPAQANQSDPDDTDTNVPSEVEIVLGKTNEPGTSRMDWEGEKESSEEESESGKIEKRQKLDSGIGDDNSPSTSPSKTDKSDATDVDSHRSDSLTDDVDDRNKSGRRRLQKRSRGQLNARSSSTDGWSSQGEGEGEEGRTPPRRSKRRAPAPPRPNNDSRRVRLSLLMKRGVKELPLPHALKKYVNLERCYEF